MAFGLGRSSRVNEVDVVNIYKVFLGRSPESQTVIDEKAGLSIEELVHRTIESGEFLNAVITNIISRQMSISDRYRTAVTSDVNVWAKHFFEIEAESFQNSNKLWSKIINYAIDGLRTDPYFRSINSIIFSDQLKAALLWWCEEEATASIIGDIDLCDSRRLIGWVIDRNDLGASLIVEVFANGRFIAAVKADKFRRELQATYGGDGLYGFSIDLKYTIDLSDRRPIKIELVEAKTRKIFAHTDVETQVQSSLDLLSSINRTLQDIKDQIQTIDSRIPALRNVTSFSVDSYNSYVEAYEAPSPVQRIRQHAYWQGRPYLPKISVIILANEGNIEFLHATIESVLAQSYKQVDLTISYAEARNSVRARPWIDALLARSETPTQQLWPETTTDQGKVLSSAIGASTGDIVCWLESGDVLANCAAHRLAKTVIEQPEYRVYLSDEDEFNRISDHHVLYHSPKFNPAYDPLTLTQVELFSGLIAADGAFLRDLAASADFGADDGFITQLEICDAAGERGVKHIPRVLLHRSRPRPQIDDDQLDRRRVYVQSRQDRLGEGVKVEIAQDPLGAAPPGALRLVPTGLDDVTATIIIPTRDNYSLLRPCIDGLIKTMDSNVVKFDILIIDNGSQSQDILDYLTEISRHARIDVIRDDRPFNWAALNNHAAKQSVSEVIIFMNDDMLPIIKSWCDELCFWALRPGTGAVGTRLLYEDGSIQHAGIVGGVFGLAAHEGVGAAGNDPGYLGRHALVRKAMAVTGACMAVRRSVFEQLGGFDADTFAVAYNDLDFCLRAAQSNLDVIYTPYASFYHFESKSRGFDFQAPPPDRIERSREAKAALLRWGAQLLNDPTYNPHFERWTRPFTRLTAIDSEDD